MMDIRRPDFINAAMTSRSHSSIREMIMAIILFFLGTFVGSIIQAPAIFVYFINNKEYMDMVRSGSVSAAKILDMAHHMPAWTVALALCASAGILAAAIFYCKLVEKRKAYSMGFSKKSCVFYYLAGLGLGVFMIGLVYAISFFLGIVRIDVSFQEGTEVSVIFLFFFGYLIEGMAEEALCRGFLLVSLTKRYTVFFSLVLSSVFFAFFRGLNSELSVLSYINLMLFGCFMGLLFLRFENIWLVGAFHGIWNFIQMNILGSRGGNADAPYSLFSVSLAEGQEMVHGGVNGMEGGLTVTLVLLLGIGILVLEMRRKGMFVKTGPVENPYDRAYYEEFQRFMRENAGNRMGHLRKDRDDRKVVGDMPINEEMIRMAEKQHTVEKGEENREPGEEKVRKTEFDQNYFKQ